MGQYPLSFILIKWTQNFRMNPKLFLVAALACLFVDFSSATFPLTFASNGIWASPAGLGTASVADAVAPTVAVSGGVVLLGALGLTIGKLFYLEGLPGVDVNADLFLKLLTQKQQHTSLSFLQNTNKLFKQNIRMAFYSKVPLKQYILCNL